MDSVKAAATTLGIAHFFYNCQRNNINYFETGKASFHARGRRNDVSLVDIIPCGVVFIYCFLVDPRAHGLGG